MKILKAAAVALAIVAMAAALTQLAPTEVASTPAGVSSTSAPNTGSNLPGVGVMCVGADPDGGWDRCAWRQHDGTWQVAEYPDGLGRPRWSCRADSGGHCPHRPHWATR